MVVFVLYFKADFENVGRIDVPPHNRFCLDIETTDESERREGIFVDSDENYELEASRGTANFVVRWPGQNRQASIKIVTADYRRLMSQVEGGYTADHTGEYVPVAVFECRGLNVVGFHPSATDITVYSSEGQKFENVDLLEGDWADYDEEHDLPVSLTNFEFKFEITREER